MRLVSLYIQDNSVIKPRRNKQASLLDATYQAQLLIRLETPWMTIIV